LEAIGGDAVPDFGGAKARQDALGDWLQWPGAEVGDVIRVISRPGGYHDYLGHGPFGDGRFDASEKGMPVEQVVGEATVVSVSDGAVTLSAPLPMGDVAYLVGPPSWPSDGGEAGGWAGAPGFAFARVLADDSGRRMVPHFAATDVASDNRLLPQQAFSSVHVFSSPCDLPEVSAVLLHRAYPLEMALQKGWALTDSMMVEIAP
jgi:hypothetical protein